MTQILDPADPFQSRVLAAMGIEEIGWLTTVDGHSSPQPNPVWFIWDDESILIYSKPNQAKLTNITRNPQVAFNLQTGGGLPVFVLTGAAAVIDRGEVSDAARATYWAKYGALSELHLKQNRAEFEAQYSATIRIQPGKFRGF